MARRVWWMALAATAALTASGCGGRSAQPVALVQDIDVALSCPHIRAELQANAARAEDLRGERVDNRLRTLSRVPGAIIAGGLPVTAVLLADPSFAIYKELNALQLRNTRLQGLALEQNCDGVNLRPAQRLDVASRPATVVAPAPDAPEPQRPRLGPSAASQLVAYEALGPTLDEAPPPPPEEAVATSPSAQ